MAQEGEGLSAADYVEALATVASFRRRVAALFQDYDLIFTPSATALPWPAAEAFPPEIDGRPVGPRGHAVYTGWVNVVGNPGLALPLGFSKAGLPLGGQFIGRFGSDSSLLAFGRSFEHTHGPAWRFSQMTLAG
ncbi:amidase family protein [Lichenifustis flavocetrariae]|uniref:Amidase family protein n=1 Tax=Lichenifustis flavocetrariae TaxID=2949735 RepID=A0AA41Z0M7_9HYPH|nr:amidase family protein [Lichenifustis flavocetrariae]MCW6510618.1 amidase family protein [Lichenifustis flavocetrariae]